MLDRIWRKILTVWWRVTVRWRLRAKGVEVGREVRFYGMPIVSMAKGSSIRIGDRVVLCSDSRFTALGVNHAVVLKTVRPRAVIVIGDDCGISGGSICAAVSVELGRECLLGANVSIVDTDFHPINPVGRRYSNRAEDIAVSPVRIEDNVFLGTNVLVLKGVNIGRNSVVGAGSVVVTTTVVPNSILAGNPARIIKCVR